MLVNNAIHTALAATRARPEAGGVKADIASGGGLSERHVAAFAVLGVESVLFARSARQTATAQGPAATQGASLDSLAADYNANVSATKDAQPGISDANARHIARYKTIMANRTSFPAGRFSLHTDLANGGAISTHVPAAGGAMDAAKVAVPAAVSGAVIDAAAAAQPPVGDAQLADAYREWL